MMEHVTQDICNRKFIEHQEYVNFVEPTYKVSGKAFLSMCAIIRDCGSRVREWLAYARAVGVEKFYIALHNCSDNTEEEIHKLSFKDDIILHHVPGTTILPQLGAYRNILKNYGQYTEWMAIVDDDEFLCPTAYGTVKEVLDEYDAYGGLAISWKWFGSNDHVLKPKGFITEAYTKRAGIDFRLTTGIKSIVKPRCVIDVASPHLCKTGVPIVTTQYMVIEPKYHWRTYWTPQYDILSLNHYKVRSMEDYIERYKRGDCTLVNPLPVTSGRYKVEDRNDIEDKEILRFSEKARAVL